MWGGCNITCGNDCEVDFNWVCYIKAGIGTELKTFHNVKKTILKGEEFIWWYVHDNLKFINTFEDKDWRQIYLDKWNEFYGFVHTELDCATLF